MYDVWHIQIIDWIMDHVLPNDDLVCTDYLIEVQAEKICLRRAIPIKYKTFV